MGRSWASPAVRRQRRRLGMMWVLTVATTVVLVVIAVMIKDIGRTPLVVRPIALTVAARTTAAASVRPLRSASASPSASATPAQVVDGSSGLSYRLLSAPWQPGCPAGLDTPMFSWSAGESAVAGRLVVAGTPTSYWYGTACSGPLQPNFAYSGVADLEPTAFSLVEALDVAYYSSVDHYRTLEESYGSQVSGHPAWVVTFLMTYPSASSEGLSWTSEAGAVVLVDRGAGQAPALFYVSVPNNLGLDRVSALIRSLRLSSLG